MRVFHTVTPAVLFAVIAAVTPGVASGRSAVLEEVPLTQAQQCAVRAALASGDARRVRIARAVLRGEAGAIALADPWILHHHHLATSATCRPPEGR